MTLDATIKIPWTQEQQNRYYDKKSVFSDPVVLVRKTPSGGQERLEFKVEISELPCNQARQFALRLHCLQGKNVTVWWSYKKKGSNEPGSVVEKTVFIRPGMHSLDDRIFGRSVGDKRFHGSALHRQVATTEIWNSRIGFTKTEIHLKVEEQEIVSTQDDIIKDLDNLCCSGDAADVHLVCGETQFPRHRLLLAARSSVFKTMFFGQGDFSESRSGQVAIKGSKPEDVKQFLRFIYTGECEFEEVDPWAILNLAKMYDVQMLIKTCCKALEETLNKDNCLEYINRACFFMVKDLVKSALNFVVNDPEVSISDDDWIELASKFPEVIVEFANKIRQKN